MQNTLHVVGEPPRQLRKARLDNIALVPASLLPLKGTYQPLANTLPKGSVLVVQSQSARQKKILERVTAFLRTHGRQVITLPIERFGKTTHQRKRQPAETLQLAL